MKELQQWPTLEEPPYLQEKTTSPSNLVIFYVLGNPGKKKETFSLPIEDDKLKYFPGTVVFWMIRISNISLLVEICDKKWYPISHNK